jgi:protein-ribulosamine 3-kinase
LITGFVPKPAAWGEYNSDEVKVYFFLGDFHDMDLSVPPNPAEFISKVAQFHMQSSSPTGMFGYQVPTVIGKLERTVTWTKSWAESFTFQLRDVIRFDNETNGTWPELDAACKQLIDVVIPRLLGALQSEGRDIKPTLIHGDLWEQNVGIDMETGDILLFDPGCTYAHNEMEFGTWRCTWAFHFNSPVYMRLYHNYMEPSEPAEEWDDRNRLYSIHPYLTDSAGHPGSGSRQMSVITPFAYLNTSLTFYHNRAYNDILYLCEKYGPLDTLEKYNPEKDAKANNIHVPFFISQLE